MELTRSRAFTSNGRKKGYFLNYSFNAKVKDGLVSVKNRNVDSFLTISHYPIGILTRTDIDIYCNKKCGRLLTYLPIQG